MDATWNSQKIFCVLYVSINLILQIEKNKKLVSSTKRVLDTKMNYDTKFYYSTIILIIKSLIEVLQKIISHTIRWSERFSFKQILW